jgi:hypothetical protein
MNEPLNGEGMRSYVAGDGMKNGAGVEAALEPGEATEPAGDGASKTVDAGVGDR